MKDVFKNLEKLPKNLQKPASHQRYGTAGYRGVAEGLESTICRTAYAACLEALVTQNYIGLMLTASHNHFSHNGIKIVSGCGGCMNARFEMLCDEMVNCCDSRFLDVFIKRLDESVQKVSKKLSLELQSVTKTKFTNESLRDEVPGMEVEKTEVRSQLSHNESENKASGDPDREFRTISPKLLLKNVTLIIGRDTRLSGKYLESAVTECLDLIGVNYYLVGVCSTPQLHWLVRESNIVKKTLNPGLYIENLIKQYNKLKSLLNTGNKSIMLDTANGVGGVVVTEFGNRLAGLEIKIINSVNDHNNSNKSDIDSPKTTKTTLSQEKSDLSDFKNSQNDLKQSQKHDSLDIQKKEKIPITETKNLCKSVSLTIQKNDLTFEDKINFEKYENHPNTISDDSYTDSKCDLNYDYSTIINKQHIDFTLHKNNPISSAICKYTPDPKQLNHECGADYIVSNKKPPKNLLKNIGTLTRVASFDGDADRLVYFTCDPQFTLIDGDRLCVFLSTFIHNLSKTVGTFQVGMVLSHYSNSAALKTIPNGVKTVLAQTGVKYFVNAAQMFDIGVFFEPNGHGSAVFSPETIDKLYNIAKSNGLPKETIKNCEILITLSKLLDPCVGDAVANLLVFEAIMDNKAMINLIESYRNLPTRLLTVRIKDKNTIKTVRDVEIVGPIELRSRLEQLCKTHRGRAFVRPSGTEDLVRVFAEAHTTEDADHLCVKVAQAVYDICDGMGNHPEIQY